MSQFIAVIMSIALMPAFIVVALLIKLESKGPVIFKQKRVGQFGALFTIYKFRTMQVGMPDLPSDQVAETDHRFTGIGKFLRRFSLDELPQLWNVVRGEMNFVGPRPALYNLYDLIEWRSSVGVHKIKPGITGWAQVNGRDSIPLERKVELDQYYLLHHSWDLDMRILWMTLFKSAAGADLYSNKH